MDETKDQVSQDSQVVAVPTGPKTIYKDQAPEKQSETTSEQKVTEPKLYKLPDGREISADDLYREHTENLLPEFTRRSQKLADYERQHTETEARNKKTAEESVAQNKLLEDVDPSVRDAIVQIVSPVIQDALSQRDKAEEAKRSNETFAKRLSDLEKKYPGGNGLPKFDRLSILRKMQESTNEIYDPEVLFQTLNWDNYLEAQIKAAMKGKSGGVSTENTSTETPRKPGESTPARSFREASQRALSR
jgi:hypothetical protein